MSSLSWFNALPRLTLDPKGYTVFSIPVGVVYRPNEAKVRNLQQKDYLGKARLVAASDRNNAFTGFAGTELNKAVSFWAIYLFIFRPGNFTNEIPDVR